ncbi:MAG TPA: radical SAM protein [Polyangiaceae bacterium]
MKVRFVYPRFARHAEAHPELREHVPCNEYFGPPSLGIACLAAVTPPSWELDFKDDRLEDVGLDDDGIDLVAISCFTPSGKRALELADAFRARGKQVVMGGIFPTMVPEEATAHADAVVLGEGEGVWGNVLADAAKKSLKKTYKAAEPVDLATLPLPRVDLYMEKEGRDFAPDDYPVQTSRGCPLTCFACAIPGVLGRKLRHYPKEHVIGQIEQLAARKKLGSLTEDTSFFPTSHRKFLEILDAINERGNEAPVSYLGVSMPMILGTKPEKLKRMRDAGIKMWYLVGGFDPVTMNAFSGKDPKAHQDALDAISKSYDHGIEPYTSFLVGNEGDDEGVFDRMLEFADRAKIRKAEFAIMTPYPGTPIYGKFTLSERILTRDWSLYNDANVVFQPAQMSPDRLLEGYLHLWKEFYRSRQDLRELDRETRTIQF